MNLSNEELETLHKVFDEYMTEFYQEETEHFKRVVALDNKFLTEYYNRSYDERQKTKGGWLMKK